MPAAIMKATPPTTPPAIAPTFNSWLVAAIEVPVEATVVRAEVIEVGVEVEMPVVDLGTGDDSGPPETKISECRPLGRRTYLHS